VKRKQTPTATSKKDRSTKSNLVFLEDDNDKETAIYCSYYRYDYVIISKFDFANLLYQNSRYRTNRSRK
jgi:hypothetical protein